jgi:hypothetical protein
MPGAAVNVFHISFPSQRLPYPFGSAGGDSLDENESVSILNIALVLQDIAGQPLISCRSVHINTETLVTGSHLLRRRTGFALIDGTTFTEMALPDRERKIVPIKERDPFNLKNRFAQFPCIMGMNKQDILVRFDHFGSFLE